MTKLAIIAATLALFPSTAGIVNAIIWIKSAEAKRETAIPQVLGPGSYAIPGYQRLIEAAEVHDWRSQRDFTIHIERGLKDELYDRITKLSSRMGWRSRYGGPHNDISSPSQPTR